MTIYIGSTLTKIKSLKIDKPKRTEEVKRAMPFSNFFVSVMYSL
ncbi:hypothetical protein CGLO_18186 [Colletotrichum gloeosporioides Cg-14]|uniref:Uncharacterized protein n=1 Tax=Colletotrichum gloeosporioides (strain Cg-14) TaxID=1237896 RepID=T0JS00_COLGC|nr:hypothetical protein CGLO_18186 [Colletotrichum gloeosporioides Cg-14]